MTYPEVLRFTSRIIYKIWIHKIIGGEGYIKDLLAPEGWKAVTWMSLSLICNTNTSHHFLSYSQIANPVMNPTWYSIFCVLCACHSKRSFWEVNDEIYFWVPRSGQAFLNISWSITLFAMVFNSIILKGYWGNIYYGPVTKVPCCHDLLLIKVSQTCLSTVPSYAPLSCDTAKNCHSQHIAKSLWWIRLMKFFLLIYWETALPPPSPHKKK